MRAAEPLLGDRRNLNGGIGLEQTDKQSLLVLCQRSVTDADIGKGRRPQW